MTEHLKAAMEVVVKALEQIADLKVQVKRFAYLLLYDDTDEGVKEELKKWLLDG